MNKKIKISRFEIMSFIESLPENYLVALKSDNSVQLKPVEILENIENKTEIGKSYYIQIGKFLYDKKKNANV